MLEPVIPPCALVRRVQPGNRKWATEIRSLGAQWQPGDEYWTFDEPAPPGINAGALGLALVRDGVPIDIAITGIH